MTELLAPLIADGVVEEVISRLKTGKEAELFIVVHAGEIVAAKVYKERHARNFRNNAAYKEGRTSRSSRTQRAMDKGSRFGQRAAEDAWKAQEYEALTKLHADGLRVPQPIMMYEGVLLMELVIDPDGQPAPRLIDAGIAPELAAGYYADLRQQVIRMLLRDLIHGDLSPFNVLLAWNGPTIIDFPQVIGAAHNSQAERFFTRDLENIHRFFSTLDPALAPHESDAREIWHAYTRRELTPEFVPSGNWSAPAGRSAPRHEGQRGGPRGAPGRGQPPGHAQGGRGAHSPRGAPPHSGPGDRAPGRDPSQRTRGGQERGGRAQVAQQHGGAPHPGGARGGQEHGGRVDAAQSQTGAPHGGRAQTGPQHAGQAHGGRAQTGQQHAGQQHVGRAQTGQQHAGHAHGGRAETRPQHAGQAHGGRAETGPQHAEQAHGGRAQTGQQHGGRPHSRPPHGGHAGANAGPGHTRAHAEAGKTQARDAHPSDAHAGQPRAAPLHSGRDAHAGARGGPPHAPRGEAGQRAGSHGGANGNRQDSRRHGRAEQGDPSRRHDISAPNPRGGVPDPNAPRRPDRRQGGRPPRGPSGPQVSYVNRGPQAPGGGDRRDNAPTAPTQPKRD